MKKLLIFLLAALTAFGAAGCGKEKGDFGRYESVAAGPRTRCSRSRAVSVKKNRPIL